MPHDHFPLLILNARPAAGKSEIIHYLKQTPLDERRERFHIGRLAEIDDFPMLWAWFEEDHLLETDLGFRRLHTDADGYFVDDVLWHLLIRRICLNYEKLIRDQPDFHTDGTVLIEFSRGSEHGGYRAAYPHLSDAVLAQAAVLYVDVSWEESMHKNQRRYNPDRPDSILEHGLSDEKMERLYREDDFAQVSASDPATLTIRGQRVPYVVFDNHDDVTTPGGDPLADRLEERLGVLWERYEDRNR